MARYDDLTKEIRDTFDADVQAFQEIHAEAEIDAKYLDLFKEKDGKS